MPARPVLRACPLGLNLVLVVVVVLVLVLVPERTCCEPYQLNWLINIRFLKRTRLSFDEGVCVAGPCNMAACLVQETSALAQTVKITSTGSIHSTSTY